MKPDWIVVLLRGKSAARKTFSIGDKENAIPYRHLPTKKPCLDMRAHLAYIDI